MKGILPLSYSLATMATAMPAIGNAESLVYSGFGRHHLGNLCLFISG